MLKKIYICIIVLLISSPLYSTTVFSDTFDNTNKISFRSNAGIQSGNLIITNLAANNYGTASSIFFTRETNEDWKTLTVNYTITNDIPYNAKLTTFILDENNQTLFSSSDKTIILSDKINLKEKTKLKLKALLFTGSAGKTGTPLLHSWEVTISKKIARNITPIHASFYAAPSPLKITDSTSQTRFYYKIKKNCKATLKIYDTNYNLIITKAENENYSTDSYLNITWDGKNGNNVPVISGVYIAILKINNDDGTKDNPDPFIFAVIR